MQVCGEAVLVVEASSQADLCRQLERLAGKHLRGRSWRLAGSWEAAGAADGKCGTGASQQERRQRQLQLQQRLLRRSSTAGAATGAATAAPAAEQAPAPGTPRAPRAAVALPDNAEQRQQAVACPAALPTPVQQEEAPAGPQACACEPRQQLLWSVAGRATSLSWQDELAAATATASAAVAAAATTAANAAVAAAATAGPADMQPQAAGDSAAAAVAAGWAGGSAAAVEPEQAGSPLPLSARHRTSLDRSPWADLQPEMLAVVLAQAGECVGDLLLH